MCSSSINASTTASFCLAFCIIIISSNYICALCTNYTSLDPHTKEIHIYGMQCDFNPLYQQQRHLQRMTHLRLECSRSQSTDGADIGEYIKDFLEVPSALQDLTLEFCNDLILKETHLANLTALRFLTIQNGAHLQMDANAFQNLNNLQLLKMFRLELQFFPEVLMSASYALKSNGSSADYVATFPKLTQLFLSKNNIHTIPNHAFGNIPNLELLDLSTNHLAHLNQESFHPLNNLQTLNISDNEFTEIPQDFWKSFPSLQILVLSYSWISVFDNETFDGLIQLVRLEVNSGQLRHIQANTFHCLPNVEEIIITTGVMKIVPYDLFHGMNSLRRIQLNGGFGHDPVFLPMDKLFLNLPNLESITAQRNNVTTLADVNLLGSQRHIRLFDLSNNNISEIPVGFFSDEMPRVENIKLQKNTLSIIASETFSNLLNLQVIDLSLNKLVYLASHAFNNLPVLHNLSLRQNNFSQIRGSAFFGVEQLRFLDLSGNRLTNFQTLQVNHYDYNDNARAVIVDMSQNPLSCDCEMYKLLTVTGDIFKNVDIKSWPNSQSLANQRFKSYENLLCRIPGNIVWYNDYYSCSWGVQQLCSKVETIVASEYGQDFLCESSSYCPSSCECYLQAASMAHTTLCGGRMLTQVPDHLPNNTNFLSLTANNICKLYPGDFSNMPDLLTLRLEFNCVRNISNGVFNGLRKLETLYLNNNTITDLQMGCFSNLTKLTTLYLHDNALQIIPEGIFDGLTSLATVTLHKNPLHCNCSLLWLKLWLQEMHKTDAIHIDVNNINCTTPKNKTGAVVFFENAEFMCETDSIPIITIIAVCLGIPLLISLLIISAIYFKSEVQILLYGYFNFRLTLLKMQDKNEDKIYDAFISYSSDDYEFVVFELVKKLEEHLPPYKVCIHQRDFLVGEAIANNIVNAIESSKRTIVILSDNYLNSEWCLYEFKVAHSLFLQEHKNRMIIVRMEDVDKDKMDKDMRTFVSMNTYLDRQDSLFWKRLLYALPNPRVVPPIELNDPVARIMVELDAREDPVYDDNTNLIN